MSIRARIFFVFATAVIIGFSLLAYWISKDVADRYSESFEEIMVDTANLLAEVITTDLNSGDTAMQQLDDAFQRLQLRRFSAQIYELEKTSVDIQVYVTDDKGIVIFDTDNGRAVGEDYSEWNDVHETLIGKYGARATPVPGEISTGDSTQRLTIAYVAAPIYNQDRIIGSVTVAKPKNNIDHFVAKAKYNLMLAVIISIVMALLLGFTLYIWVSRPLQALVDYAHSVGRGERITPPQLGNNEIGKVGDAMEGMRQSLEDKQYVERYVQSLTHEIKSPLTAIHAAAELLGRDLPADKRTQFVNTIVKETDRLNDFANQLLQLAALEKRQRIENPESISVEALAKDIVETHTLECESRHLKVALNLTESPEIHGDRFLIRQAIDNLFRNAIEMSPSDSTITFDIHPQDDSVSIEILDEGPGIPDYVGDRVFERFFSLPRPDTGRKGTGLGLNFAREVAQLHDGLLVLENRHPGTCARLLLPVSRI
ncbi:Sensory histidine kinase CreC of two-component signal transduction system CreBC [hydrothermal vent metagenome]|uniref:histidine kinase n=1 Tax=hydrothermal vent metagenome TaxID=652676 RepID=A0A3B0YWM7_9ZZZZ